MLILTRMDSSVQADVRIYSNMLNISLRQTFGKLGRKIYPKN